MLNTLQLNVPTLKEMYKKDQIRNRQKDNFQKAEHFATVGGVPVSCMEVLKQESMM